MTREDEIPASMIKWVRAAFTEGVKLGIRWQKLTPSIYLGTSKIDEALDEWLGQEVPTVSSNSQVRIQEGKRRRRRANGRFAGRDVFMRESPNE